MGSTFTILVVSFGIQILWAVIAGYLAIRCKATDRSKDYEANGGGNS